MRRRRESCSAPRKGERVPFARRRVPGLRDESRGRRRVVELEEEEEDVVSEEDSWFAPLVRSSCDGFGLRHTTSMVLPEESSTVKRKM